MGHHVVPERRGALEVLLVGVRQRAQVHEERVAVVGAEVESRRALRRRLRSRAAARREEVERAGQQERAVMVHVVAEEPVGLRRLRRDGFERGMRVHQRRRREEAPVRDAPDRPLGHCCAGRASAASRWCRTHRVLSSVLRGAGHPLPRRHVLEVALGHEAPAHILIHEDESLVGKAL